MKYLLRVGTVPAKYLDEPLSISMASFKTFLDARRTLNLFLLNEASYVGNIGIMEMVKFFEVATKEQIQTLKSLIAEKKQEAAWKLLMSVTGVKLK